MVSSNEGYWTTRSDRKDTNVEWLKFRENEDLPLGTTKYCLWTQQRLDAKTKAHGTKHEDSLWIVSSCTRGFKTIHGKAWLITI
jgi:hypothetical protein